MEESLSLVAKLKKEFNLKEVDIRAYSPLTLAYVGDAIYDVIIRTVIVQKGNRPTNSLHKTAIKFVNAAAQSGMIQSLTEDLTETELSVYRRGRNAKFNTKAKNATISEYRNATGFEALIGYLYLTEQMDRILFLITKGLHNIDMKL